MTGLLVSGALGYLGRAFVAEVHEPVVALVRGSDPSNRASSLRNAEGQPTTAVVGDVRRRYWDLADADFDHLAGSISAVVNLAAVTAWSSPWEQLEQTNVLGARHACEVAARLDVPLVHVSSLFAAYALDGVVAEEPVIEASHLTKYERSKNRGEWLIADAVDRIGLAATIVRIGALGGDAVHTGRRTGAPLLRLLQASRRNLVAIGPHACIDFVPRDVAAAALARVVRGATIPVGLVHHISLGDAAPTLASLLAEMRSAQHAAMIRPVRVIQLPSRRLLELSLVADRFGTSVGSSMLIGLRYLASSARYQTTETFGATLTLADFLTSLGYRRALPAPDGTAAPRPTNPYYEQWATGF